jgi:hypothetical protein
MTPPGGGQTVSSAASFRNFDKPNLLENHHIPSGEYTHLMILFWLRFKMDGNFRAWSRSGLHATRPAGIRGTILTIRIRTVSKPIKPQRLHGRLANRCAFCLTFWLAGMGDWIIVVPGVCRVLTWFEAGPGEARRVLDVFPLGEVRRLQDALNE